MDWSGIKMWAFYMYQVYSTKTYIQENFNVGDNKNWTHHQIPYGDVGIFSIDNFLFGLTLEVCTIKMLDVL